MAVHFSIAMRALRAAMQRAMAGVAPPLLYISSSNVQLSKRDKIVDSECEAVKAHSPASASLRHRRTW
jgi:hypothetical protein